ncbi:MAG: GMC family oxidoreductase N-terminal domain-containing protein [Chloroflexota bacterium]|nr:GMC family oxidoreductase N-terminal domain-containing protein [Chloroflexota bacterium]
MPPAGWSARELATLAALAETFVRGAATRRANLAANAFERAADPAQVRQVRLVLRLVESRAANLMVARRATPFRDMAPATRERYLLGWASSRIGRRRSAFQAFRKVLTFLAYADPGDESVNPRWAAIGYRNERPPVTQDPTAVRPFIPPAGGAGPGGAIRLEADVVVVGSGAGGGVVAADLAAAGRSVVILDAGPFVDERTMPATELDGFDHLYLNHGLTTTWDGSVTMLAGTGVGGGTLINWLSCLPAPEAVRAEWTRDHGIDGLEGAAFATDLAALESELSVTPATTFPPKDRLILRAAEGLGWRAGPVRRNSPGCSDCGSCGFGCPRGAKQSGIRVHLAAAQRAGARIVADARVDRVVLEGGRVAGVEATLTRPDGTDPSRLVVRARQVVVAAGALRTPGIVASAGDPHPALGRHLRIHPVPVVAGRFLEPVEMWRRATQAAHMDEFSRSGTGRLGYVIESAPAHPGLIALAMPWEGTEAHAAIMEQSANLSPLVAVTRDGGEGRVSSRASGGVRIDYHLDRVGVATLRHAIVSMARLARAAGATEIIATGTPPAIFGREGFPSGGEGRAFAAFEERLGRFDFGPNRGALYSAHQMGTARMGADPRVHVCDPSGRVRSASSGRAGGQVVGGLYVADGSLFPTAIGVNPMITIMTLARQVGRTVLAEA